MSGKESQAVDRPGQADVAQNDIGGLRFDQAVGRDAVPSRSHDGEVGHAAQQRRQPLGDGRVVLDDRKPDQASASASGRE